MSDYVLDYVWAFALALIITFALTPLVKRFAVAVGAIDKPDARKVHHGAIPRITVPSTKPNSLWSCGIGPL